MTEHRIVLWPGEVLRCTSCSKKNEFKDTVYLVANTHDEERIGEVLCQKCADKRGE